MRRFDALIRETRLRSVRPRNDIVMLDSEIASLNWPLSGITHYDDGYGGWNGNPLT